MEELTIRTATEKDAAALLDIYRPYVERTAITFEYEVPTLEEFRQRICHTLEKYPYLVTEAAGEIVGYAYLSAFHPKSRISMVCRDLYICQYGQEENGIGGRLYGALSRSQKNRAF